ncbi:MAG: ABC transporter substrate-binding protein [Caldilineaceae bacterium SB0670_bin_27]|uniref:ABC transporter substrate-binding protein n=1 Tax=Caldilineaceae bacterium SB0664_bin_27 TaxID=2605260 RepID=A0A6B0YZT6_9CHLR|nr:ABC transporter substrate-binding protein [Caldilineaceae bacterium SB0664_bin_27]MYJ77243.1 ABC transporter substrate-binding protein [Caldilineaceae bacterium SB0670_bin_27]
MTKTDHGRGAPTRGTGSAFRSPLLRCTFLLITLLFSGACIPRDMVGSPLGTVVVGPGEDIQIRTAFVLSSIGQLGSSTQRAVVLALEDYGPVKGHKVTMGAGLDSLCTPEGGTAAAQTVVGDRRVVGVIGTSCSAAAVKASPILSEAGLVLISPTNTAPSLTSDLRGNAGADQYAGYYRTSNNDLYEAEAVAEFAHHDLGLHDMAVFHDGDPYTSGLANAFATAFEQGDGSVTIVTVSKGQTDMIAVLSEVAAANPDGLFLPLFPEEAGEIIRQMGQVAGLEGVVVIGGAALLDFEFLAIPESEGMYLASPVLHFGSSVNEATGKSGGDLAAAYLEKYNEAPGSVFMAHAYDATTLLLRAIEEVAVAQGDSLYIDRARLREALTGTAEFSGIIGELTCDEFGDCGTGHLRIVHHTDSTITDVEALEIVYYHLHDDK